MIHQNSQSLAVHYASTVAKIPVMMEAHSHVVAAPLEWGGLADESGEGVLLASASVGTGVTVILRVAVLVLSTGSWQRVPENLEGH